MTDRTTPSAGFWITVALVAVLVGYPLSAGPVCWTTRYLALHDMISVEQSQRLTEDLYAPAQWVALNSPAPVRNALEWYLRLWI
jgi:hypothetical protein